MASYFSELNHLAYPVTTREQCANRDIYSVGLVSARKAEAAIEILKLTSSTCVIGLCQAIDHRRVEEAMQATVDGHHRASGKKNSVSRSQLLQPPVCVILREMFDPSGE